VSIWYVVKNVETGVIRGHDTFWYNNQCPEDMVVGELREQRRIKGKLYYIETYVDASTYKQALVIARSIFSELEDE
jgi:hypothetical protein